MEWIIAPLIIALIVLGFWLVRVSQRDRKLSTGFIELQVTLQLREQEVDALKVEVNTLRSDLRQSENSLSQSLAENKQLQAKLDELKQNQSQLADLLEERFRGITSKLIDERAEQIQRRSEDSLKPLREDLKRFGEQVQNAYSHESRERHALQREIRLLVEHGQKMSQEANSLTKALKGDNKVQGDWGEMILEHLLASSGLRKGEEYTIQETLRNEDGQVLRNDLDDKAMRPDAIVYYPNGSQVIIDSKVSLKAYAEYMNSEEDEERHKYALEHLASLRRQIDLLSSKAYHNYVPQSAEFVMLFIPNEPAYILAMKYAPTLWEEAYKKNVILMNASNLLAALRMAKDLWQREGQMKNVEQIFKRVGELYDKFASYIETLEDVDRKFQAANKSLEKARGQLTEGKGNIIRRFENIRQMGAKASKSLPASMIDIDEE